MRNQRVQIAAQRGAGARAADVELAVPHAADHIHIDHRDRFVQRQFRMVGVVAGAEQPQFLARERHEQDAALRFRHARSIRHKEMARQFDHARRAGGVIVRARMNGSGQRRRQRELPAQPQMIVMRADDQIFVGLAGQISQHVMHGLDGPLHIHGLAHFDPGSAKERGFTSVSMPLSSCTRSLPAA